MKHSATKPGCLVLAAFVLSFGHAVSAYGQTANPILGLWDTSAGNTDYRYVWDQYGGLVPDGAMSTGTLWQFQEDGTFFYSRFSWFNYDAYWFLERGKYEVVENQIFLSEIHSRALLNGRGGDWKLGTNGTDTSTRLFELITRESDGRVGIRLSDGSTYASGSIRYDNFWFRGSPIPTVPEPETWAMLLAGLGVTGALARRRRRQ